MTHVEARTTTELVVLTSIENADIDSAIQTLFTSSYWADRQSAAHTLGQSGSIEAREALISALPEDSFWKVRCTIIQALEQIGDRDSLSVLQQSAELDENEIVRDYARVASVRLLN